MMRGLLWLTVAAATVAAPMTAACSTIHVPSDQPTIQTGINAASAGDTVLVACATYYEHDIVMKSGICLRSETGEPDCVTIDALQLGRVFYGSNVDSLASIEGFTVTGGSADDGGGMRFVSSSLTLTDCTFVGNTGGTWGGGMFCNFSSPTLTDCTFVGNSATPNGRGGGMSCYYSSPTLTGCTFVGNTAGSYGGGMDSSHSSPSLTNCTFVDNAADDFGGGMHCFASSPVTLTACTFVGNQADLYGGGLFNGSSSSLTLTACIIAFSQQGEAVYGVDISSIDCCDVYGNAGGDWVGSIAGQYGVNGNFSADPLFCGDLNPEQPYTLHVDSPCAPENNPECGLIGAWGVGCGLTAVESTSWGAIKAMFR